MDKLLDTSHRFSLYRREMSKICGHTQVAVTRGSLVSELRNENNGESERKITHPQSHLAHVCSLHVERLCRKRLKLVKTLVLQDKVLKNLVVNF